MTKIIVTIPMPEMITTEDLKAWQAWFETHEIDPKTIPGGQDLTIDDETTATFEQLVLDPVTDRPRYDRGEWITQTITIEIRELPPTF